MDLIDTLSVILGLCECGSDYKSWALVSAVFHKTLTSVFSNPKRLFGNRLVCIIEESNSLDIINEITYTPNGCIERSKLIGGVTKNRYIPQWWKDKHIRKQKPHNWELITIDPTYSLEYMDNFHKETGRTFSCEKLFCRPFENEDAFNNFSNEAVYTYKLRFTDLGVLDFHHSVSVSRILNFHDNHRWLCINFHRIPITHYGYLSDNDWILLKEHGVSRELNSINIYWWPHYKSTTIKMISDARSSYHLELFYWLSMCDCPNLTVDLAIEILNNYSSTKDKYLLLLAQILLNEFGYN